jgi:hypothetical protein
LFHLYGSSFFIKLHHLHSVAWRNALINVGLNRCSTQGPLVDLCWLFKPTDYLVWIEHSLLILFGGLRYLAATHWILTRTRRFNLFFCRFLMCRTFINTNTCRSRGNRRPKWLKFIPHWISHRVEIVQVAEI